MINTIGQNEKFSIDGSILSVASMTDSIGIDPSRLCPAKCNGRKKGQCQKICCSKLIKKGEAEVHIFFNKKLHRIKNEEKLSV
jgi:hypothetical protein